MIETQSTCYWRTLIFRFLLVVAYIALGSGIFHVLERDAAAKALIDFNESYNKTMTRILSPTISNHSEVERIILEVRREYLEELFPKEWNFDGGFNITIQAITTIGYGNTVPKTTAGRLFLIIYATVGIPLMGMMLKAWGEKLKHFIKSCIIAFEMKLLKRNDPEKIHRKSLIAVFVLTIILLCVVSAISTNKEDWDFSVAIYFWFVTFTTIGFGDFVPKGDAKQTSVIDVVEISYNLVSFLLGLVLISTIIQALSDWVNSKTPPSKEDIKRSFGKMASTLSTQLSTFCEETQLEISNKDVSEKHDNNGSTNTTRL